MEIFFIPNSWVITKDKDGEILSVRAYCGMHGKNVDGTGDNCEKSSCEMVVNASLFMSGLTAQIKCDCCENVAVLLMIIID